MRFNLKKPCGNCPFRNDDQAIDLAPGRVEDLINTILCDSENFVCHKTISGDQDDEFENDYQYHMGEKDQLCAGAMIYLEKLNRPNQFMRIAERLGGYDRTKLEPYWDMVIDPDE